MFTEYIAQILAPVLRSGDIVIIDNLSVHKNLDVGRHIRARNAELLYLPAYNPEFNSI